MNETTIPEEEIRKAWDSTFGEPDIAAISWEHNQSLVRAFKDGYLAHAAKHTEEVAKKDGEIERLKVFERGVIAQMMNHRKDMTFLRDELTAAREREEKAVAYIEALEGYHEAIPATWAERDQAKAAYDASRAATKEGA